jgi:uncharacterized protein
MRAYTVEKIGPKRERTPEGFLICYDVPLARIGEQIYGPDETPVKPKPGVPYVTIKREPTEVFRAETLASALGKPFVIQHPDEMSVTPQNARDLSRGHIMAVRAGQGDFADVILGDVMVMDAEAIDLIDAGMREVSMGYDCDYDELGDPGSGLGRQRNILFNHVALVDQGRCGPRCAIGDHSSCDTSTSKESRMATTDRRTSFADKLTSILDRAFKAKDEKEKEAIKEEMKEAAKDDAGEAGHHIEVHNHLPGDKTEDDDTEVKKLEKKVDDGFKKIGDALAKLATDRKSGDEDEEEKKKREEKEKAEDGELLSELEMEAPSGTGDKARKANDSIYLDDSFQRTIADADILAPGIRVPTFDAKAKPKATFDAICGLRRSALDLAYVQPDTRGMIEQVVGGRAFDSKAMKCGDVRTLFNSVAAMKRVANNNATTNGSHRIGDGRNAVVTGPVKNLVDLQKTYDEAYKRPDRRKTS